MRFWRCRISGVDASRSHATNKTRFVSTSAIIFMRQKKSKPLHPFSYLTFTLDASRQRSTPSCIYIYASLRKLLIVSVQSKSKRDATGFLVASNKQKTSLSKPCGRAYAPYTQGLERPCERKDACAPTTDRKRSLRDATRAHEERMRTYG